MFTVYISARRDTTGGLAHHIQVQMVRQIHTGSTGPDQCGIVRYQIGTRIYHIISAHHIQGYRLAWGSPPALVFTQNPACWIVYGIQLISYIWGMGWRTQIIARGAGTDQHTGSWDTDRLARPGSTGRLARGIRDTLRQVQHTIGITPMVHGTRLTYITARTADNRGRNSWGRWSDVAGMT